MKYSGKTFYNSYLHLMLNFNENEKIGIILLPMIAPARKTQFPATIYLFRRDSSKKESSYLVMHLKINKYIISIDTLD